MKIQILRLIYLGFFSHFLLPDYDQQAWQVLRWIGIFCVLLLSFQQTLKLNRWILIGLCLLLCINKTITLFFLRDVLTQSFYLLLLSLLLLFYHLKRKEYQPWEGIEEKERDRDDVFDCFLKPGIIYLTASVYWLAAIHKLNHDFLATPQSCALHGVNTIVQAFHLPPFIQELGSLSLFGYQIIAVLVILLEIAIGCLLLYQKSIALLLAIPFHLPLTLTIAPAFGLIMLGGLAMSLKREEIQALTFAAFKPGLYAFHLLLLFVIFMLKGELPHVLDLLKTVLYLWIWLGLCWIKLWKPKLTQGMHQNQSLAINGNIIPALIFSLHGLLFPYLGIEVQHSSAMLSNLRIDSKCHNSLIFPNLGIDPYYYLDQVQFADYQEGEPYQRAQKLRQTLWHWAAFYTMKQNWCGSHLEPIYFKGHTQQARFEIQNLCDEQDFQALQQQLKLRFWDLNQWQRFQKNLSIDCHDVCVH